MNDEKQKEIRDWGESINHRVRQRAIEEKQNESYFKMMEGLDIPVYLG